MALPNSTITPIPNNEPDAVPGLWNTRYTEIDENFVYLESQRSSHASTISSLSSEVTTARGGESTLDERLDALDGQISLLSPEGQMAIGSGTMFALDQAALAVQGVELLRTQQQQEGDATLQNRGVIKGCSLSKSVTSARNVSISAGVAFMGGREWVVPEAINAASVPSNPGINSETVFAYLYYDAPTHKMRVSITPIGALIPDHGIHIYTITIPANSTDETDQYLASVSLTSVRRLEPDYPRILVSPQTHSVSIQTLSASDYRVDFDVVSADGEPVDRDHVRVFSRATNGFVLQLATSADNVHIRWRASKLNN